MTTPTSSQPGDPNRPGNQAMASRTKRILAVLAAIAAIGGTVYVGKPAPAPAPTPTPVDSTPAPAPTPPVDSTLAPAPVPAPTATAMDVKVQEPAVTLTVGQAATLHPYLVDSTRHAIAGATAGITATMASGSSAVATIDSTFTVHATGTGSDRVIFAWNGHRAGTAVAVAGASPAPAPAPAPAPTPAPTPGAWSGLSGLQLVGDDYTTYASTADFLKQVSSAIGGTGNVWTALYHDGRYANTQVTLDPTAYHGHPALRYAFPVGGGPPELWPQLPRALDVAWFRSKIRFAPGFTTIGNNPNSANAYKLLGMAWAPGQGNGRLDYAITNTTEYQLAFDIQINGTVVAATPWVVGGHIATEWTDGQWYDYILEYNRTSPTTAVARAWMVRDGQPPVLVATASTTRTDGGTLAQIGSVMLGLNFNQPVLAPMEVDRGPWEVVDGVAHPDPYRVHGGVN